MALPARDLRVSAGDVHDDGELWQGLTALCPWLIMYRMSSLTLGNFLSWSTDPTQPSGALQPPPFLDSSCVSVLVTSMPFTTGLLAESTAYRIARLAHGLNISFLGVTLSLS
jgi:hypothetical protein